MSCRYTHVMAQPMVPPPMRDIPMQMQYPEMVMSFFRGYNLYMIPVDEKLSALSLP
jgi:hypothetical protein